MYTTTIICGSVIAAIVVLALAAWLSIWYHRERAKLTPEERRSADKKYKEERNLTPW
jgi:H+/gluconate symporter-like permease